MMQQSDITTQGHLRLGEQFKFQALDHGCWQKEWERLACMMELLKSLSAEWICFRPMNFPRKVPVFTVLAASAPPDPFSITCCHCDRAVTSCGSASTGNSSPAHYESSVRLNVREGLADVHQKFASPERSRVQMLVRMSLRF